MNTVDWVVLLGTMIGIAAYGTWRTRHTKNLNTYLKGNQNTGWLTIGVSVMATQASTITYLSLPGQAYENGINFIQNYFGLPLALIIVCAAFLPIYRKLGVYTAYEYLGNRFDAKTRLLGAALFLLQRGLAAGVTIYAPAIILSTVLGWRLDLTIVCTGVLVIIYTVTGGSAAVSLTQKWQMAVIFGGMIAARALDTAESGYPCVSHDSRSPSVCFSVCRRHRPARNCARRRSSPGSRGRSRSSPTRSTRRSSTPSSRTG